MNERQIYGWLLVAWVGVALSVVPYLLLRPAPYGRHARPGWGPTVQAQLAWVLMEAPAPLLMIALFALGNRHANAAALAFLGLWLAHYVYRAFLYPLLLPAGARAMPAVVLASGAFFNLVNGYLNGRWLFSLSNPRPLPWLTSPRFVLGCALFVVGLCTHVAADRSLRRLRSVGAYTIPRGPLFRLVSCPNYLGEIIEWSGWALATWSLPGLVFALWTAANLIPRAMRHHRWYREKFADYPKKRRAIVPFVL
jgi:hypothetical protein